MNSICSIYKINSSNQSTETNQLIYLDANNSSSYNGSGNTWTNLGTGGTTYNATRGTTTATQPVFQNTAPKNFLYTRATLNTSTAWQSNNYFSITRPTDSPIVNNFTYCAWIKTTSTGYSPIFHYTLMYLISSEVGGVANDFGFGVDANGKLAYGDGSIANGGDITISSNTSVNTGNWVFVAVTRQNSNGSVVLYINGVSDKTGTCNANTSLNSSTTILIGSGADGIAFTWGGNIASVYGYSNVLTSTEILALFNSTKSTYGL